MANEDEEWHERDRLRRRKLKELEQRVLDLVQEDLRKEIPDLLTKTQPSRVFRAFPAKDRGGSFGSTP